jgi:Fur family ferric uptake transcriptional regulator
MQARRARHRETILALLSSTGRFHSARQVHTELRRRGSSIGIGTVYRTLHALAGSRDVDVTAVGDGVQLYRRCGSTEHHHLTCRHCGTTVELHTTKVRDWAHEMACRHGYQQIQIVIQLHGTCAACAAGVARAG